MFSYENLTIFFINVNNCFYNYFHTGTWLQRTCGPLNPGSLRGSIFALMSCALGAGAFALPKALFLNCGFVIGIIFLVFTGAITLFSLNLLMKCSVMANRLNYPDLAEHCFGKVIIIRIFTIIDI